MQSLFPIIVSWYLDGKNKPLFSTEGSQSHERIISAPCLSAGIQSMPFCRVVITSKTTMDQMCSCLPGGFPSLILWVSLKTHCSEDIKTIWLPPAQYVAPMNWLIPVKFLYCPITWATEKVLSLR